MKQNKKVIGLTGNIASGKSTVSDYLKEKGFAVIDADKIAREVVEPGKVGLENIICLLYTSPSPRDRTRSRMPSSA